MIKKWVEKNSVFRTGARLGPRAHFLMIFLMIFFDKKIHFFQK